MESLNTNELIKSFLEEGVASVHRYLDQNNLVGIERLKLFEAVRSSIDSSYIDDHKLDRMREIYEASISEALAIADGDEALIEHANVLSYNLSANLADCWDDAVEPRTNEHFQAGIAAANRCLELRKKLKKPPVAMAMAFFILGVHEYSLQHYADAEKAWSQKLEHEYLQYQASSDTEGDLNVLLSQALIGLARCSIGLDNVDVYKDGIRRLEAARTSSNKHEVDLFISELVLLRERHGGF